MVQYKKFRISTSSFFVCNKSGKRGKIKSKDYQWRPAIHLDRIIWVIYQRFVFHDCKYSTSSIDSLFLVQLPAKIRERFPFIFKKSIGVHKSIIQLLMSLCTKSVLLSSLCSGVNEVHRIKHSKSMLNYLDHIHEIVENKKILFPNKEFILDFLAAILIKTSIVVSY